MRLRKLRRWKPVHLTWDRLALSYYDYLRAFHEKVKLEPFTPTQFRNANGIVWILSD
jgi:hypothetical protein